MPPRKRIFREDILKAAVHLVQQEGASALSVRNIAKELNCSTQPIYSQFESMETLRDALMAYIREAKFVTYGEQPVAAYLAARESEMTQIRIIMAGRSSGLSPEAIRERLRTSYV